MYLIRCIGEYADLLASPQPALPAVEGGAGAGPCPAREAMPEEEASIFYNVTMLHVLLPLCNVLVSFRFVSFRFFFHV